MLNAGYRILTDAETDELFTRKLDEWRNDNGIKSPTPAPTVDSFEKIAADFPWLFGDRTPKG